MQKKNRPENPNGQNIKISSARAFSSLDMRQTVGAAASGTFAARCPAMLCTAVPRLYIAWRSGQALNLQPTVLETIALPIELPE